MERSRSVRSARSLQAVTDTSTSPTVGKRRGLRPTLLKRALTDEDGLSGMVQTRRSTRNAGAVLNGSEA